MLELLGCEPNPHIECVPGFPVAFSSFITLEVRLGVQKIRVYQAGEQHADIQHGCYSLIPTLGQRQYTSEGLSNRRSVSLGVLCKIGHVRIGQREEEGVVIGEGLGRSRRKESRFPGCNPTW